MNGNEGNRKAFLLVFAVFALGIALGGVGMYVVTSRVHAARPQASVPHTTANRLMLFTHDLNLNPDQQKQIEAIFNDTRAKYTALHQKLDPEYEQVRQEGREKIRQILTPEQKPKFEELLRQMDEDRRQRQAQGGHD